MKKAKLENKLKEIMLAAGYSHFDETNRSYFTKAVNQCLTDGRIEIKVAPMGRHWVNKVNGKKFDLKVTSNGWISRTFLNGVYTSGILRTIGKHLQIPQVREKILAEISLHEHCSRCGGSGFIQQFHYYCNGICFECYGTGFSKQRDLVEIKKES